MNKRERIECVRIWVTDDMYIEQIENDQDKNWMDFWLCRKGYGAKEHMIGVVKSDTEWILDGLIEEWQEYVFDDCALLDDNEWLDVDGTIIREE